MLCVQTTPAETAAYLRTLPAIRERCSRVHALAQEGKLQYFDYHPENEHRVADFCIGILKRDYGSDMGNIRPHSRWRHLDFGVPRIAPLMTQWSKNPDQVSTSEVAHRILDLFVVSVLLDAGAGSTWSYTEKETGAKYTRSEGLAVASVNMFTQGLFSGDPAQNCRVDAEGLSRITPDALAAGLQVSDANPIVALEGRAQLLVSLAKALKANPQFFGHEGRPGNIIDFLESQSRPSSPSSPTTVPIAALWHALIEGLSSVWPPRLQLAGIALGDVWECPMLADPENKLDFTATALQVQKKTESADIPDTDALVPLHKLTMWLSYSLVEVLESVLKWNVDGVEDMTGLPEYRNGGLLVDLGVLTLKPNVLPLNEAGLPHAPPSHPAIVEWRAMTVIELDRIASFIRTATMSTSGGKPLTLAQILEGATWKGGREIASTKRPETGGPPIEIDSDGTVF